jgi:hypothetical protein
MGNFFTPFLPLSEPHFSTLGQAKRSEDPSCAPTVKSNLLAIIDTTMRLPSIFPNALAFLTFLAAPLQTAHGQPAEGTTGPAAGQASSTLPQADLAKEFKLPGLVVNQEDRCVDLDATVCLKQGALELIACTKGTKEHESIVAVEARPIHIHTTLLLGVPEGNPAMRKPLDEKGTRWSDVPPRGGAVNVFLVVKDKDGKTVERPISDFIKRSDHGGQGMPADTKGDKNADRFPTHTFLFAGSILHGDGEGPRRYLCDESGNVISIATFGDEVLCLPEVHSSDNGALMWSIDSTHLPAVSSKIILRLRPQAKPADKGDKKIPDRQPSQPAR